MKGRGAQQRGCHNPLRRRLLFVTGCAGETGTSQSLSWPPSSFAIASLEVITSIATRQSIMLSRSVARLPTPLTALLHDAPAAAQERCPLEGRGPVAAAVGVAFVVGRRDEAGSTSCPPSCSRRRTASACPCCAARWSGGFGNYGSLEVTRNSTG